MGTKEYKNDFLDRYFGEIEALAEARLEARGRAEGKAEVLVKILDARAIGLTSEQRDLVVSCTDPGQLDIWVDRALAASSADEVFKD
jgi:hypothetical protein